MNQREQEELIVALMATAEIMGSEIKPNVAVLMVDDLSGYALNDVLKSLVQVRRECSGRLTLKLILDQLKAMGGWVSANEAWAISLPALDERVTVVWTAEAEAAFLLVRPLLDAGDRIGARMAFIPAYERLVDDAKQNKRQAMYQISNGWDLELRKSEIDRAVASGLLLPEINDQQALPAPKETPAQKEQREEEEKQNQERLSVLMRELAAALRGNNQKRITEVVRRQQQEQQNKARKLELIEQLKNKSTDLMEV